MPIVDAGALRIDFTDEGAGEPVVLVHSSVSGNRQWRKLSEHLAGRYRVLAVNLYGYGETSPWPGGRKQTLADQVALIEGMLTHATEDPVHIVGHSYGGAVAMKAARMLGARTLSLALYEPNPFYLLVRHGRSDAFEEVAALRAAILASASEDEWHDAGRKFCDYWMGAGAWAAMPPERQETFLRGLRSTYHEWDGVTNDGEATLDEWRAISAPVLLLLSTEAQRPIVEIADLLQDACPRWRRATVPAGGHMAPLTRPDIVNPLIAAFLDEVSGGEVSDG